MCFVPFLSISNSNCKLIGKIYVINNDKYLTFDTVVGIYINTMKTTFLCFDLHKLFSNYKFTCKQREAVFMFMCIDAVYKILNSSRLHCVDIYDDVRTMYIKHI